MRDEQHTCGDPSIGVSAEYFPVAIDSLGTTELAMDLFIRPGGGRPVLYLARGSRYGLSDCRQLADRGITHLFVRTTDHQIVHEVLGKRIAEAYDDPEQSRAERSRIVRDSCGQMIAELMQPHTSSAACGSISGLADQFAAWCTQDESKFSYLLDMSEHDFYTITHMVNVGVGCGLLAAELFGDDEQRVRDITQGGLVHDIGKRDVPAEILNKEGKLSDEDWLAIRAHPELGYAELVPQHGLNQVALDMTLDHHERMDGKGYPRGLTGDQISLPARICAVVDVYDALTAARPYRGPIPPFRVLEMMREDVGAAFDPEVFGAWERVIGRLIEQDPQRAVVDSGQHVPNLDELVPMPVNDSIRLSEKAAELAAGSSAANTEQATLVTCSYIARGSNPGPATGRPFPALLIARDDRGFELELDHPAAIGDRIALRDDDGRAGDRGEVASVRHNDDGGTVARFTRIARYRPAA